MTERTFVLHDGEDENETEKLHEFLDGLDWEGSDSGVSIYLHVSVGDTIIIEDSGALRIVKKETLDQ